MIGTEGAILLPHIDYPSLHPQAKFIDRRSRRARRETTTTSSWTRCSRPGTKCSANMDYAALVTEAVLLRPGARPHPAPPRPAAPAAAPWGPPPGAASGFWGPARGGRVGAPPPPAPGTHFPPRFLFFPPLPPPLPPLSRPFSSPFSSPPLLPAVPSPAPSPPLLPGVGRWWGRPLGPGAWRPPRPFGGGWGWRWAVGPLPPPRLGPPPPGRGRGSPRSRSARGGAAPAAPAPWVGAGRGGRSCRRTRTSWSSRTRWLDCPRLMRHEVERSFPGRAGRG